MKPALENDIRQILSSVAEVISSKSGEELTACKNDLASACERLRGYRLTPGDKREILAKYAEFALSSLRQEGYSEILKLLSLLTAWPVDVVHNEIQERLKIDRNLKAAFQACPKDRTP